MDDQWAHELHIDSLYLNICCSCSIFGGNTVPHPHAILLPPLPASPCPPTRGGAAVAQAGNVAVPGAAREHFVPSAIPACSSSPQSASTSVGRGPATKVNRPPKRKTSSRFNKRVSSAFDGDEDGDDERGDEAAVVEGGIGLVDVGRGASAGIPVPQRRLNLGGAGGAGAPTSQQKEAQILTWH